MEGGTGDSLNDRVATVVPGWQNFSDIHPLEVDGNLPSRTCWKSTRGAPLQNYPRLVPEEATGGWVLLPKAQEPVESTPEPRRKTLLPGMPFQQPPLTKLDTEPAGKGRTFKGPSSLYTGQPMKGGFAAERQKKDN